MSRLLYHLSYTAEKNAWRPADHPPKEITGERGMVAAAGFEPATFGL